MLPGTKMPIHSYQLGDVALSHHTERFQAADPRYEHSASLLKVGDGAMVLRNDGNWRCAIVKEISTDKTTGLPFIVFFVSAEGSTKKIPRCLWSYLVRPLTKSQGEDKGAEYCLSDDSNEVGSRPLSSLSKPIRRATTSSCSLHTVHRAANPNNITCELKPTKPIRRVTASSGSLHTLRRVASQSNDTWYLETSNPIRRAPTSSSSLHTVKRVESPSQINTTWDLKPSKPIRRATTSSSLLHTVHRVESPCQRNAAWNLKRPAHSLASFHISVANVKESQVPDHNGSSFGKKFESIDPIRRGDTSSGSLKTAFNSIHDENGKESIANATWDNETSTKDCPPGLIRRSAYSSGTLRSNIRGGQRAVNQTNTTWDQRRKANDPLSMSGLIKCLVSGEKVLQMEEKKEDI